MDRFQIGMLVKALTGHDAGRVYMITNVDDTYVYLVDGCIRTLSRPKKKKFKHVQIINEQYDIATADDVAIKRILKVRNENAK